MLDKTGRRLEATEPFEPWATSSIERPPEGDSGNGHDHEEDSKR